jgi:CspA family cold shock protein
LIIFHFWKRVYERFWRKYLMARMKGKVKWFSAQKGYGFIEMDDGKDIFVHHSAIQMEGFRALEQGDQVEFEVTQGPKGPQAINVKKV